MKHNDNITVSIAGISPFEHGNESDNDNNGSNDHSESENDSSQPLDNPLTEEDLRKHLQNLCDSQNDMMNTFVDGATSVFGSNVEPTVRTEPSTGVVMHADAFTARSLMQAQRCVKEYTPSTTPNHEPGQTLQLSRNNVGQVEARLIVIGNPTPSEPLIPHKPIDLAKMYTPMTSPPTLRETIELFTLADDQARLFALLATDTGKRMHKGIPVREYADQPLRVLGTGGPGTGKTHVVAAYEWHAFHHHNASAIRKASYTWRAAHHLNSPISQATSTCKLFGINPFKGKDPRQRDKPQTTGASACVAQQLLGQPTCMVIIDEASMISQTHFAAMSNSAATVRKILQTNVCVPQSDYFGDLSCAIFFDMLQHAPPGNGSALFVRHNRDNSKTPNLTFTGNPKAVTQRLGRRAWCDFKDVIVLKTQHRMAGDIKLQRFTELFSNRTIQGSTRAQIEELCNAINDHVVQNVHDLDHLNPHYVCTRNIERMHLNRFAAIRRVRHYTSRSIISIALPTWK